MVAVQTIKIDKFCRGFLSKCKGLMFSRRKNIVLEFGREHRVGLHTFFVFYPIDVAFLNARKKVVEIKKNFRPFRLYNSKKKAKYVVEISKGKLNKSTTNLRFI